MPPPQAYPQQAPRPVSDQGSIRSRASIRSRGNTPQQGQYPPPYPPGRPQYAPYGGQQQGYNQPQPPAYAPPTGR